MPSTAPTAPELPPARTGHVPGSRLGRIDAAVHLGFAVLIVASVVRYVMRHSAEDNLFVLALAAAACALYAVIAVLAQRRRPWALWMFVLVAVWAVLVVSAPSFAWCSFALFFLCRIAFTGAVAYAAAGATAAATAAGLFRLSDGTDLAMLLGPLAVGVLLTLIYDRIEHDAAEQRRLHHEVSLAQRQLAASERRAGTIAERERVSREIHDTVTQGLASSLLLLEAANRAWPEPASRQDLREASNLLRRNLSDTRSLVHELASPASTPRRCRRHCSRPPRSTSRTPGCWSPANPGKWPARSAMPFSGWCRAPPRTSSCTPPRRPPPSPSDSCRMRSRWTFTTTARASIRRRQHRRRTPVDTGCGPCGSGWSSWAAPSRWKAPRARELLWRRSCR
jgi:hypothetical protein